MDLARAPLLEIIALIRASASGATDGATEDAIEIDVLDPDRGRGHYAGERLTVGGEPYIHRPFRTWVDLAERLGFRLCTPRPLAPPLVRLRFEPLDRDRTLRGDAPDPTEKYGAASAFARLSKLEDPGFVLDMADALARIALPPGARVLDLGVNTGDELALLHALAPASRECTLVGVDHSASAIAVARQRFTGARVELHVADVTSLGALNLGRFDLVMSIGTLQSPGIDDRELLRTVVQDHLTPGGAVLLGIPNCRYVDGEVEHGARMLNFSQPELGLLVKDVAFYRKYLQQHRKQVFVTGKHYVLVTAVAEIQAPPVPSADNPQK